MRTILLFILLLSNGLLSAQTNTALQKTDTAKSAEKHVIDPEANEKALAEIRRKTEQREKILKKYKGKKAHLKKSDTTAKAEEAIVPENRPTEK